MGNRATAPPNKTAIMSKVSAPKMALLLKTKRNPSFKLSITGSPILGFKMGFLEIRRRKRSATNENPKIKHMDQCTPIQPILNPAKAGPITEATCHVELLQVAAFGYIFFGYDQCNQGKYRRAQ